MTNPLLEVPPHPRVPKLNLLQPGVIEAWKREVEEWQRHPAVVAQREEEHRRSEERIEALRPKTTCAECVVVRTDHPERPWHVDMCGPHRVDELMRDADGFPGEYRPVPIRYRSADPAHIIPKLRDWDGSRSLYLAGPVGTGKTYQAAALVRYRFRVFAEPREMTVDQYWQMGRAMGRPVVWANVPKLLEDLRRSFDAPDLAPVGMEFAPLVVLDDIGAEKPSEWVEERLYCIVNERYESGLPIIVTSNLTPQKLGERLGARLASRFAEMCDVYGLGGKDRRLGAA